MRSSLVIIGILVLAGIGLSAAGSGDAPKLRWVTLSPDQAPAYLERVKQGSLIKLPRAEFDSRLREGPRLVEAVYRARLVEPPPARPDAPASEPFLEGTGQWQVMHSGTGRGVLTLQPLSLALRKPRFENQDALIGAFDGANPSLLLETPGRHTVTFEWTARADVSPEGLRFDWRVPSAPVGVLEIELPAGRSLAVSPENCLVQGPEPTPAADRHLWRVRFGQVSSLHLRVSPRAGAGPAPDGSVSIEHLRTTHQLMPDGETSDFVFDLKVQSRERSTLVFSCDPALKPFRVIVPQGGAELDRWEFAPGAGKERSTLMLYLRRPFAGTLQAAISCRSPLGALRAANPKETALRAWSSAGISLKSGAAPRTETLVLRVHPQIRLESWRAGNFQLDTADTEKDGTYKLTLTGAGVAGAVSSGVGTRPSAILRTQGVDYRARALLWWQLGGPAPALTAQIVCEVRHGRLFEIPILIAPGWEVIGVSSSLPAENIRHWSSRPVPANVLPGKPAGQATLLNVELDPPIEAELGPASSPGMSPSLTVQLRSRGAQPIVAGQAWSSAVPIVLPMNARQRDGVLAIDWEPELFEATVHSGSGKNDSVLRAASSPPRDGPWGDKPPRASYSWHGEPTAGIMRLQPRPVVVRLRTRNDIQIHPGRLKITTLLSVQALAGGVSTFDLRSTAPLNEATGPLRWEMIESLSREGTPAEASVRSIDRARAAEAAAAVSVLASPHVLAAAAMFHPDMAQERWRLTLAHPLRAGQSLVLRTTQSIAWPPAAKLAIPGDVLRWPVSLIVAADKGSAGEVRLFAEHGDLPPSALVSAGQHEASPAREPVAVDGSLYLARSFQHDGAGATLLLAGKVDAADHVVPEQKGVRPGAVLPWATLLTQADRTGRLTHQYTFEVRDWPEPTQFLPLRLPAGARVNAVRVDGWDVTGRTRVRSVGGAEELDIPLLMVPSLSAGEAPTVGRRFEILYATDRPAWKLWARLDSPLPEPPLRPLAFRHVWRLPSDVAPINQARLLRLPGGVDPAPLGLPLARRLSSLSGPIMRLLDLDRWVQRQEQAVRMADAQFRRTTTRQELTVAEALAGLDAAGAESWGSELVVDVAVLEEAERGRDHRFTIGQPPPREITSPLAALEPAGLVYVPCKPAPLVTTRRQWRSWIQTAGQRPEDYVPEECVPRSVIDAVEEAAAQGRDSSGRFRTVADWLGLPSVRPPARPTGLALDPIASGDELAAWIDWEVVSGDDDSIWVVRADAPAGIGLVLVTILLATVWRMCRARPLAAPSSPSWRGLFVLLLLWIGASGTAYLSLPAGLRDLALWPLLATCLVAFAWFLSPRPRGSTRREQRSGSSARRASTPPAPDAGAGLQGGPITAATVVLIWALCSAGPAHPQTSASSTEKSDNTVYLLRGSGAEPENVFITPNLFERWRRLEPRSIPEAVLIRADYVGDASAVNDKLARFRATFHVWCANAGKMTFPLPLDGIAFDRDMLVDGKPVRATALSAPQVGYGVPMQGPGLKVIEASFVVSVVSEKGRADLRFSTPRTALSHVLLRTPKGSSFLQSLVHLGAQRVTEDNAGPQLDVDVGAVTDEAAAVRGTMPLHFRWHTDKPAETAAVDYQEAHVWDLSRTGHTLTSVVQYRVGPGSVSRLTLDVPAELLVADVDARRANNGASVALRDWHVVPPAPGTRGPSVLHVDFQTPVTGECQLILKLHPRSGLADAPTDGAVTRTATVTLPVPRPHGKPVPDGGFLGYRLQGLEVPPERIEVLRLSGIDPNAFPEFFGKTQLANAYKLRREGNDGPVLRLGIQVRPPRREASQQLIWRIGADGAQLHGTLEVRAANEELALIEWEVPATVEVTSIRGSDVRDWTLRRGANGLNHAQVWLTKSVARTRLEVTARAALTPPAAGRRWLPLGGILGVPLESALDRAAVFTLPTLRLLGTEMKPAESVVELIGEDGTALAPMGLRNLLPAPGVHPTARRFVYLGQRGDYAGSFLLVPAEAPTARVITTVDMKDNQYRFQSRIAVQPAVDGSLRSIRIDLKSWPGADFRLEGPADVRRRELSPIIPGVRRSWLVEWDPRATGPAELVLSGSTPLAGLLAGLDRWPAQSGIPAPDVRISGVRAEERWLIIGASAASFAPANGASATPDARKAVPQLVAEARAGGSRAWLLNNADDAAGFTLTEQGGATPAVRVLLREHVAALIDRKRWLHQTTWWVYHTAPAEVDFVVPEGADLLAASVDGIEQPLRQRSAGFNLSLAGSGAQRLCLRWTFAAEDAALSTPNLSRARLTGDESAPAVWVIHVPPGYEATDDSRGLHAGPLATAEYHVLQAETQHRLRRLLMQSQGRRESARAAAELLASQTRFDRHAQAASLLLLGLGATAQGADARELRTRLQGLQEANRELVGNDPAALGRARAESARSQRGVPFEAWDLQELAREGRSLYRVEYGSAEPGPTPRLRLVSSARRVEQRALAVNGLLICALLVVWVLSSVPFLVTATRLLWPELMFALGLAGWQLLGPTWPVIFLLALAALARLLWLLAFPFAALARPSRGTFQRA